MLRKRNQGRWNVREAPLSDRGIKIVFRAQVLNSYNIPMVFKKHVGLGAVDFFIKVNYFFFGE